MFAIFVAILLGSEPAQIDREHHASAHPLMHCVVMHITERVEEAGEPVQRTRLMIRDLETGDAHLLHAPAGENAQEPRWSPDGEWIAFVGGPDYTMGSHSLFIIRPDGTDLTRLAGSSSGLVKSPFWTPDSQSLVFEVRNPDAGWAHIDRIRIDGTHRERLTASFDGLNQHPRVSPDGQSLLVAGRDENGESGDLYLHSLADPSQRRRLTHTPEVENMPAWSPDAGFIVYARAVGAGGYELFAIPVEGGPEIRITHTPDVMEFFPSFSPDGTRLYYDAFRMSEHGPRSSIETLDLTEDALVRMFAER